MLSYKLSLMLTGIWCLHMMPSIPMIPSSDAVWLFTTCHLGCHLAFSSWDASKSIIWYRHLIVDWFSHVIFVIWLCELIIHIWFVAVFWVVLRCCRVYYHLEGCHLILSFGLSQRLTSTEMTKAKGGRQDTFRIYRYILQQFSTFFFPSRANTV
jgi:hypothetical protein